MAEKVEKNDPFDGFSVLKNKTVESLTIDNKKAAAAVKEILDPKDKNEQKTPEDLEKERLAEEARLAAEQEEFLANSKKDKKTDKPEEDEDSEEEEEEKGFSFKNDFIKPLVDKGLVNIDTKELEELEDGEESVWKAVELTVEKRWNEKLDSDKDEVKVFREFVEAGGDPKKFLELYYNEESYENYDPKNERDQKNAISRFLEINGADETEIAETLADFETSGLLEKQAEKSIKKLQAWEKEQKKTMIEAQKKADADHKAAVKKYWEDLEASWMKKEDLNGFPLTEKIKKDVFAHMTKPVDKKTGKSQLAINNETNQDAQFLYAYLDMLKWDISKLEKQVKTKVTSDLNKKLQNYTDSRDKLKSGKTKADEENTSFAGFKALK